jgi:hypothetical protein
MGTGLEDQKTFEFPKSKPIDKVMPGEQYMGLNKSTHDFINKLTLANFFGSLELKFESGKIVHIIQNRSIKP